MNTRPIAAEILSMLIDRLGQQRWLALSDADRVVVEACCLDAAELQLAMLSAGSDAAVLETVRREKAHVAAQLRSIAAVSRLAVQAAIWDAASNLLIRVGTALVEG